MVGESAGAHVRRLQSFGMNQADAASLNKVLHGFSKNAPLMELQEWQKIADSNLLAVADVTGSGIVGMATLVINRIPTGRIATIEDVAVLESMRNRGLGKMLMHHLIQQARLHQLKQVDLTSRPTRIEANRLYLSLGFRLRETNTYRLTL